ncbi:MAG: ATP-binding protein [Nanoarchaeota archaeon]
MGFGEDKEFDEFTSEIGDDSEGGEAPDISYSQKNSKKENDFSANKRETSKSEDLIIEAKKFFDFYKKELGKSIRKGSNVIYLDFMKLTEFSSKLPDEILSNPEDALRLIEMAIEESGLVKNVRVRLANVPKSQEIKVRNIRSKNLNEMIVIEGIIRQASDVRPQVVNAKFECPSCLPRGTLIQTPIGLEKIENVKEIISVDKNFKLVNKKVKVIEAGIKKIFRINNEINSSGEHKWFVYRNGITKVIQTKNLKVGDVLYRVYGRNLHGLQEENSKRIYKEGKKNLQLGMQKDICESNSEEWRKDKIGQSKNNGIISIGKIYNTNGGNIHGFSQIDKKKINENEYPLENYVRTMQNKYNQFKYIQAWKEMWRKRILKISKRKLSNEMYDLRKREGQNKKVICSSQRWESLQQQNREFNDNLQFMSYEVTQINETKKEVEMYDLQVPDTNNFILGNGVITHNCGTIMSVLQIEKKFREPPRCSCGRRGGFKLISKEMVDTQRLVVEEAPESLSGGEQPKRINVFVKEDLVEPKMEEKTTPGSRIKVIGILKEVPVPLQTGGLSTRFELAIEANNVIPLEETFEELDITDEDERQILELSEDPMIFENLARSITPSIWGYEEIKKSLVLQLFSGVQKTHKDGQKSRGDIHILLIGDPGVAKSVCLVFMAGISPKGRYVVGKSTSGAGLTATVVRDEYLRGWSLEAGAMVLSNKGLVCIDELEKMDPNDRSAMHEAMEQQSVTISKANVQARLRAETSVLAAANPKFGRFDPSQPIAQQIDLPPTLINRFDIIFTLRDIPNRQKDEKIAEHVLNEHRHEGEDMFIPRELFRKYVAYAKQRVKPELSDEAVEEIKNFYVELRNKPVAVEGGLRPIPISARQLQALVRMAEASAKVRLSKKVTKEDAIKSIEIMKYYLMQVGYDYESKTFDIDRISGKFSSSERGKIFTVRDIIFSLENKIGKLIPIEDIEKELEGKMKRYEIDEALIKLETNGDIFHPKKGYVSRTG